MYSKCADPQSAPPPRGQPLLWLCCNDRPSMAELPPYTVPPRRMKHCSQWVEENRPREPLLYPLLQKSDSLQNRRFHMHRAVFYSLCTFHMQFSMNRSTAWTRSLSVVACSSAVGGLVWKTWTVQLWDTKGFLNELWFMEGGLAAQCTADWLKRETEKSSDWAAPKHLQYTQTVTTWGYYLLLLYILFYCCAVFYSVVWVSGLETTLSWWPLLNRAL